VVSKSFASSVSRQLFSTLTFKPSFSKWALAAFAAWGVAPPTYLGQRFISQTMCSAVMWTPREGECAVRHLHASAIFWVVPGGTVLLLIINLGLYCVLYWVIIWVNLSGCCRGGKPGGCRFLGELGFCFGLVHAFLLRLNLSRRR